VENSNEKSFAKQSDLHIANINILTKCNNSNFPSLKHPFALILADTTVFAQCLVTYVT